MLLLLALLAPARAELPLGAFPECGEAGGCPSDFGGWPLYSWIPDNAKASVRPAELAMGSGMSADVAFRRTTGRWDVPIAILDSGIFWDALPTKIRLNAGELPRPRNADGVEVDDLDGNGIFNISDWTDDARVDVAAGVDAYDDRLDPSDLIHTFSDGVDDDGNGYVDDIAGWDFFGWDNDPFAALQKGYASHGTGVMKDAAQEGGDGGGIGICPNCAVIPVRIGDTFITDGDRAALGIAFAVDSGARVIGMAVGAISHPGGARDAVAYADLHDVVIVSAAGDENSYHHNLPAAEGPILYVHTVKADADDGGPDVYSFQNFNNCNNYGPRVDLVAGKNDCATGSTAVIAGASGLLLSAAADAGVELSGDEARALLRNTVDDIYLTEDELEIAETYPSKPGWDAFYGYGRINIGRAVEAVYAGAIPPSVRVYTPGWFSWVDPDAGPVEISGRVAARRDVSWRVEVGVGAEPAEWAAIGEGTGPVDGALASFDPSAYGDHTFGELRLSDPVERMRRAHEPLVQVRVTATDAGGLVSEERHGFWVHRDPDLLPGFPKTFDASLEPPPVLADLDGDGVLEIVLADAGGAVHALSGSGAELPGFPVTTDAIAALTAGIEAAPAYASGAVRISREGVAAAPAVGDIDGDGLPEIVVASLRGQVYAWRASGERVPGFPVAIVGRAPEAFQRGFAWDDGVAAAPSLGDVDGDGDLEIVVGAMDQRLYVWNGAGALLPGYPLELCQPELCGQTGYRILSSPALGDIDGDGDLDAALGTNEVPQGAAGLSYVVDLASASVWTGWPKPRDGLINQTVLPVLGEGHPSAIALADVDGDGDLELASNAMLGSADVLHHDGSVALDLSYTADGFTEPGFTQGAFVGMATNPAFGDVDGDGRPEFAIGGSSVNYLVSLALAHAVPFEHALGVWSGADGRMLRGFPRMVDDVSFLVAPSIGDVSGDGRPEVLYGSGGFLLYAWDADAELAPGFPKFTGGWILGAAALGDIDGDGYLDVVVGTREGALFAWRTRGRADQAVQWASAHHDAQNTGNWHAPLPVQVGPPGEEAGGCCARRERPDAAAAGLLLLPFAWRRRRQRPVE